MRLMSRWRKKGLRGSQTLPVGGIKKHMFICAPSPSSPATKNTQEIAPIRWSSIHDSANNATSSSTTCRLMRTSPATSGACRAVAASHPSCRVSHRRRHERKHLSHHSPNPTLLTRMKPSTTRPGSGTSSCSRSLTFSSNASPGNTAAAVPCGCRCHPLARRAWLAISSEQ